MAGFGDVLQRAFYLGVGLASYAGEKTGATLAELRERAQKLADEMVERGEMSAEEARRFVEETMGRAMDPTANPAGDPADSGPKEPRRIQIEDDEEDASPTASGPASGDDREVEQMRRQVADLEAELRRLRRN